ncbi:MAG: hypothetical protein ABI854_09965, partial [Betaproteobacteria bacterium]
MGSFKFIAKSPFDVNCAEVSFRIAGAPAPLLRPFSDAEAQIDRGHESWTAPGKLCCCSAQRSIEFAAGSIGVTEA